MFTFIIIIPWEALDVKFYEYLLILLYTLSS